MKIIFLLVSILFLLLEQKLFAQKNDSIIVSNAVLHYYIQGEGEPILFLSGGPGDSHDGLSPISEHLSKDYQCILFDQRGTGESHTSPMDSTTINLAQAISDINLLLQRLKIKPTTIIGHSWGAMLAISYAIKHPGSVMKLILIGPGPLELSDFHITGDNIYARYSKAEQAFINLAIDSVYNNIASEELQREFNKTYIRYLFYNAWTYDSLSEKIMKRMSNPRFYNDKMFGLMMQDLVRINYNAKPDIPKLWMPILVICGRQDPVGIFQTFTIKELNNKAKIAWINKSGHFPWVENPKAFYSQLLNFLK